MKKFLALTAVLLLMSSCAWADTDINTDTFPDDTFRGYVHGKFDTNRDNILQDSEIASVVSVDVAGIGISSLEGIETFTNLTYLNCSNNNNLNALDLTALTHLREVICTYCGLSELDVSRCTALESLICFANNLDVLDVTHNTALVSLDFQSNNVSAIDLGYNTRLQFLDCSDNNITSLNLAANTALRYLYCRDLNLSSLNVSNLPELHHLWCWNSGLSELDLTANTKLESLMCYSNDLTALNLYEGAALTELQCSGLPLEEEYVFNTILPLSVDAENGVLINSRQEAGLNSSDVVAVDAEGNTVKLVQFTNVTFTKVRAVFEKAPALVKYNYATGNDKAKMTVSYLSESGKALAPAANGIFVGTTSGDIIAWRGIPYAKSPTGALRWKAPVAPDDSNEVFSAATFAPAPIQHESATNPSSIMPRGEDCLALNVWTNVRTISDRKPVMVWIHGGSFNSGGTCNPDYNGQTFIVPHDDVVFVSVGYRVGLLGFIDFANAGIPGSEKYLDSANLGLLDMLEALRWVQDNITAFGGDPNNVTVFGESSGSACVSLLVSMPESVGLFHRAITESGAVSMTSSVTDCLPLTLALVQLTSADTMEKLLALSESDLLNAAEKLQAYTNFPERDGRIVAEDPYTAFASNSANFDLLTGTNADEVNYWSLALGEEGFAQFIPMGYYGYVNAINSFSSEDAALAAEFIATYTANNEGATELSAYCAFLNDLLFRGPTVLQANNYAGKRYVYYWEYPSGIPGVGACHALDVPYVFNDINHFVPMQINQNLAAIVQRMWVNFAKTGNPSTDSIVWPEYDTDTQATMIIAETPFVRNANLAERYALIEPLLKYMLSGRELISGMAAANDNSGEDVTPAPDSGDDNSGGEDTSNGDTPKEEGNEAGPNRTDDNSSNGTIPAPASDPGKKGGGCNAGFAFPMILAGTYFALRRKH